jgi:hypothetical protein
MNAMSPAHGGPASSGPRTNSFAEANRVEAFNNGIFAVAATSLVLRYPVAGLVIACALPMFYA